MHIPERTTPVSRFDGVDVLRGLSILAVILLHTFIRMNSAGFSLQQMLPPWLFHLLFRNGDNGVTVFFAISGFLITFTSLRRFGSLSQMWPKQFYRIRFARIAPLLLLILAVLSILHLLQAEGFHIAPQKATLTRALFAALTFHLNWLEAIRGYFPPNWDVLWSLSVEEMFYLFFPIVCVLLFRFQRGKTLFVALLLIFVAMGPFARSTWTTNPIWQEKSYLGGMDGIALGCLSALLTDRLLLGNRARQQRRPILIALEITGGAMMFLIALWPRWSWMSLIGRTGLDGTVLALGTCLVIVSTVLMRTIGSPFTAPIRWFGRHSYEVYLTHEFVVVWGTQLHTKLQAGPLAIWVIAILVFCAPLGAIAAKYFSEPLNRKLRQHGASKTSTEPNLVNA
jgi:peptidoglycan/LPS O-acetylase OafA/YrhL